MKTAKHHLEDIRAELFGMFQDGYGKTIQGEIALNAIMYATEQAVKTFENMDKDEKFNRYQV